MGVVFKIDKNAVATGIDELKDESLKLRVYPNPTGEILNVELEMLSGSNTEITVTDVLSNVVIQHSSFKIYNSIDVSALPKGIYFIKVGGEVRKFVRE